MNVGAGSDLLNGGDGRDHLNGGTGDDTFLHGSQRSAKKRALICSR
ncbi:hypothetical protein [Roseovarius sp. MBR-78]